MEQIENELELIKQIVDNSEHVIIDEDSLFAFSKNHKLQIKNQKTINKIEIDKIIQTLLKENILKTNNPQAKQELEASAKLSIYLINQETQLPTNQIQNYLIKINYNK